MYNEYDRLSHGVILNEIWTDLNESGYDSSMFDWKVNQNAKSV